MDSWRHSFENCRGEKEAQEGAEVQAHGLSHLIRYNGGQGTGRVIESLAPPEQCDCTKMEGGEELKSSTRHSRHSRHSRSSPLAL